jgi:hypothetical protein
VSLKNRIDKLEEEAEPERCDNCRDWPDPFIVFEKRGKDPLDGLPDYCPKCGYEPVVIIVHYTKEAGRL